MRKIALFLVFLFVLMLAVMPTIAQGTIVDVAGGNPDLSTTVQAVQSADPTVLEALSGAGPLTVFAPNNAAWRKFADYLQIDLEDLFADRELISLLLRYHVVSGSLNAGQVAGSGGSLQTVQGGRISVTTDEAGNVFINGVAQVVTPNVAASNGIVHVIEDVVFPGILEPDLRALAGSVNVRLAQFSPDTRGVDFFVDNNQAGRQLTFGTLTEWTTLPFDDRFDVAINRAGVSTPAIEPSSIVLDPDAWVTVVVLGSSGDGTLQTLLLEEPLEPLGATDARVTVLHAIEGGPAVDLLVNGEAAITGAEFGQTATAELRANQYNLQVVPTGETEPVVYETDFRFRSGNSYLVIVGGSADDPTVEIGVTNVEAIADPEPAAEEEEAAGDEEAAAPTQTIADIATGNPDFSTLVQIVLASDPAVLENLSGEGPITVFAPTNAAFDAIFEAIGLTAQDAINVGGAELLTPVLMYHVLEGQVLAADLAGMTSAATMLGEEIAISASDSGVVLNENVNVTSADIMATNGVIHVIDAVLLPQVTIDTLAAMGVQLP